MIDGVSVAKACRYLNISRQAYYQHCARSIKREEHEARVIQFVRHERMIQPRIGSTCSANYLSMKSKTKLASRFTKTTLHHMLNIGQFILLS